MTDRHWLWIIGVGVGLFLLYLAVTAPKGIDYENCDSGSECAEHFNELECGPYGVWADDPELCPQ